MRRQKTRHQPHQPPISSEMPVGMVAEVPLTGLFLPLPHAVDPREVAGSERRLGHGSRSPAGILRGHTVFRFNGIDARRPGGPDGWAAGQPVQLQRFGTSNAAATPAPLPGSPNRQMREYAPIHGRPSAFPRLTPRASRNGTAKPNRPETQHQSQEADWLNYGARCASYALMNSPAQRPAQLRGPDGMVVSNVSGLKTLSTAGLISALTAGINGRTLQTSLPAQR